MNIALLTEKYTPDIGGLAISTERFAHLLVSAGHHVRVFCPGSHLSPSEKRTYSHQGVGVTRFGAHQRVDDTLVDWVELIVAEHRRIPFDVLHAYFLTRLANGQWRRVVEELTGLAEMHPENKNIRTEIAYLSKHGEAGRLKYPTFRALGLPLGSGAIESSIRRVINLRLKGNGIFWREDNAEEMLQVRAQVITNRWDERVKAKRRYLRYDGRSDWRWEPQPMSSKA